MPTVYYRALLEPAGDGGYGVVFPEVPGCTSGGDSAEKAARNAVDALTGHLGLMIEDGEPLPAAAPLDAPLPDWLDEPGEVPAAGLVRLLVGAELPGEGVRVDVRLDEGLVARVDAAAAARGMSRAAFLVEGARVLVERG